MTEGTLVGKFIVEDIAKKLAEKRKRCRNLSDQIDAAEVELKKLPAAQAYDKLHNDLDANLAEERELEKRLRESALRVAIELEIKDRFGHAPCGSLREIVNIRKYCMNVFLHGCNP